MRDVRRVTGLAKACAVVGIALALHGIVTDQARTFRIGTLTLITSIGVTLHLTSRMAVHEVMAHQARVARLTAQERQRYTEIGYRAAQIDARTERTPGWAGDAGVTRLPHARHTPQMRRDGSA
jgi:hypothetical protein